MLLTLLGTAVAGYLLGSVPFGYLIGRMYGIDVRKFGSGATGGTNVLRSVGPGAAIATGLLDLAKGTLAAWAGWQWGGEWGYVAAAVAAMLGHSYPAWLGWRGGKAVATAAGGLLLHHAAALGYGLVVGLAFLIPTRFVSLGSITAAITVGIYMAVTQPLPGQVLGAAAALIVLWRHRENIARLVRGTENRLGQKARPRG